MLSETIEEGVDVLVVGGSLVGLSTALFLRLHGISCLAVERHSSTAIHPRAGHFQLRTMEILRSAGLEETVRRRSEEQYHPNGGINNVESLAGREIASYFPNLNAGVEEFSPTGRLFIDQDALEPIIRERAEELGATLRYRAECASLSQDTDGVTASLRDLDKGTETTLRSRFVVAADGNRSPTRERLGIGMRGHGVLSHSVTIYFRAEVDLAPLLEGRYQGVNYVTNPVLRGARAVVGPDRRGEPLLPARPTRSLDAVRLFLRGSRQCDQRRRAGEEAAPRRRGCRPRLGLGAAASAVLDRAQRLYSRRPCQYPRAQRRSRRHSASATASISTPYPASAPKASLTIGTRAINQHHSANQASGRQGGRQDQSHRRPESSSGSSHPDGSHPLSCTRPRTSMSIEYMPARAPEGRKDATSTIRQKRCSSPLPAPRRRVAPTVDASAACGYREWS